METAEEILKTAPKESVNVAVWNVLLSGFAKERKYQRMFKAFNDVSGN
jgi:pentatricopeptide repeat protein